MKDPKTTTLSLIGLVLTVLMTFGLITSEDVVTLNEIAATLASGIFSLVAWFARDGKRDTET